MLTNVTWYEISHTFFYVGMHFFWWSKMLMLNIILHSIIVFRVTSIITTGSAHWECSQYLQKQDVVQPL